MILSRYLIKEVFSTLLGVTFVLLLIFLSNQLVRNLGYAASGKLAANLLWQLMEFEVPYLLALLLPLGLYLGIMLAYGRLYAESEMRIMHIGGYSMRRLVMITSLFGLGITLIVLVLMLWVNPSIAAAKSKLINQSLTSHNILNTLVPGRFQASSDGKRVIYVEHIARNHKTAENLFIAEQKDTATGSLWTVLSAAHGYKTKDQVLQAHFMVATEGYRYEGVPGQNDYKIIKFKKYAIRLTDNLTMGVPYQTKEVIPTKTLWQHYQNPEEAAELQWRLSVPFSAFLLALLAIPLSYVQERQGRYSRLLPAILIYITYVNLLFVARNWIESKLLPISVGMWWVHGLVFALALFLILLQSGVGMRSSLKAMS